MFFPKLFLQGYIKVLMMVYLLHHIQLRAMWELLYPASQLFQLYHQSLSFSKKLLLSFLLGRLHHLENDIAVQNQVIFLKKNVIYCCLQTQGHYLITELKDMEDFLRPDKDDRIKVQILWLNDVDIQEVDQSAVGFLLRGNKVLNVV